MRDINKEELNMKYGTEGICKKYSKEAIKEIADYLAYQNKLEKVKSMRIQDVIDNEVIDLTDFENNFITTSIEKIDKNDYSDLHLSIFKDIKKAIFLKEYDITNDDTIIISRKRTLFSIMDMENIYSNMEKNLLFSSLAHYIAKKVTTNNTYFKIKDLIEDLGEIYMFGVSASKETCEIVLNYKIKITKGRLYEKIMSIIFISL